MLRHVNADPAEVAAIVVEDQEVLVGPPGIQPAHLGMAAPDRKLGELAGGSHGEARPGSGPASSARTERCSARSPAAAIRGPDAMVRGSPFQSVMTPPAPSITGTAAR